MIHGNKQPSCLATDWRGRISVFAHSSGPEVFELIISHFQIDSEQVCETLVGPEFPVHLKRRWN